MIHLERLTKRYGAARGVERASFDVGRGEIVGLLGPNGAGKSTTMRMLTTCLRPTSGRANLAGFDVLDAPLEVRRKVGYLPENVPLYSEMRVREYLDFRARLKDVPRSRRRAAIESVLERCGLTDVEERILGQLSKGYRQRVGLAEAMVHDPDILILDEPTSGLDPIQIIEVRALIRELGANHTILLSTHILSEVEAVCGRMIIIAAGKIVDDSPLGSQPSRSTIVIEAKGPSELIVESLAGMRGVEKAKAVQNDSEYTTFEVKTAGDLDLRDTLASAIIQRGWSLRRLDRRRFNLEDHFIEVVNRASLAENLERKEV